MQAPRGQILDRNGHVLVDNPPRWRSSSSRPSYRARTASASRSSSAGRWSACRRTGSPSSSANRPGPAGEPRDAEARRQLRPRLLPAGKPGQYPGVSVQKVYVRNYRTVRRRRRSWATPVRSRANSSRSRATRACSRAIRSARRGREHVRQRPAGINGMTRAQVDAEGQPTGGVLSRTQPRPETTSCCPSTAVSRTRGRPR